MITSYNGAYQEEYEIPIHSLWHAVEVYPSPPYVTSLCKLAIALILSLPQVHFLIVYSREREDLKGLIMCNDVRFFVRHRPSCDEICQAPPSPCLHILSDQKLDSSQGLESLLYQCVYLFKVEIASIWSTRLFSTSHIQKTERRKVGLGLKVKVHRSIGIP